MTTTCQQIVDRARAFSALNTPLTSDRAEMLSRIRADQRALYAAVQNAACERFQVSQTVDSTNGAARRTIALSDLTPPVGRVVALALSDGTPVRQVDIQDQEGHFAPRYTARGLTLVEVGSDWSEDAGIVEDLTLTYVQGPTDIDPAGTYAQEVSLPDEWTDLLVLPLAAYLHQKDPGRDPSEFERLLGMLAERRAAFDQHLTGYAGEVQHAPSSVYPPRRQEA